MAGAEAATTMTAWSRRALRFAFLAVVAALLAAPPASAAPRWRDCQALIVSAPGTVLTVRSLDVLNGSRGAGDPAHVAFLVRVRGARCAAAWELLSNVLVAADEPTALAGGGFRVAAVHKEPRVAGHAAYSVAAARGAVRVRYWRFGGRVALDHSLYRSGQWIDLYGTTNFGKCTGAWVIEPRSAPAPVGVTAGHCARRNFTEDIPVLRGFEGHEATRLGTVLSANPGGLDAAIFSIDPLVGVAQQVERGGRVPLTATGWVRTRDQDPGDRVCFAGRTSGADRCGRVVRRYKGISRYAVCTDIHTDHGDSGGPVYTPDRRYRTRAMGIVIERAGRLTGGHGNMCYTPIEAVLDAFDASFAPGPLVRGPGFPA